MADRYAVVVPARDVLVPAAPGWSRGDPVRAVAVLVVATPCPLILAAPVALVSGVSRAARAGVIVKGGGVIERLGAARTVLLDKTGTLTLGDAAWSTRCVREPFPCRRELLRRGGSLDQASSHVIAAGAGRRGGAPARSAAFPAEVEESPGQGVRVA